MKGKRKKEFKRMLKACPSYQRNPNTYWRMPNGEALDANGDTVFFDKVSDTRKGARQIKLWKVPNEFLTEQEKNLISQIKIIRGTK